MSTYYAEAMPGSQRWRVVKEDLQTREIVVIGHNLDAAYARELAGKLQKAMDELSRQTEKTC